MLWHLPMFINVFWSEKSTLEIIYISWIINNCLKIGNEDDICERKSIFCAFPPLYNTF